MCNRGCVIGDFGFKEKKINKGTYKNKNEKDEN